MAPAGITRSRLWLGLGVAVVVAVGLASRRFPWLFPAFLGKYPGDAMWALMAFLGWAFVKPRASARLLLGLAFATSCLVEFSLLYHAPWLDDVRSTTVGHLVLGSMFSWFDIAAYAVGALIGMLVDVLAVGASGFAGGKRLISR